MLAILDAYRSGLLSRQNWLNNIVSGVIVGVVALPLAMAFAIASGAKPEQGLYTAIISGFIVSLFGGSRLQIAGPTGAFIVILAGITAQYGIEGLQIATFMGGIILVLMGILRLGNLIRFIPAPVIIGFTSGIGIIIWVGQWQDFFGLPKLTGSHFHQKFWHLMQNMSQIHIPTTLLAVFSLCLVLYGPRLPHCRRIPGPLIALIAATSLHYFCGFAGIKTIGSAFGGIPQNLPQWHLPELTWEKILILSGPAFAIAMLGAIESLLSAVVADSMAGTRHNSNQELIGQGLANILCPLAGGFAATGAIARTATNVRNGATSPLSGAVHALTLLIILIALAPLAGHIPLATLAAILFVVAWNMSEAKHFIQMVRSAPKSDIAILVCTFLLTIFTDLILAVGVGITLAIGHFLYKMSLSLEIKHSPEPSEIDLPASIQQIIPEHIQVLSITGPFFFGAMNQFENALYSYSPKVSVLIIHLQWIPVMDITGIQTFARMIKQLQKHQIHIILAGGSSNIINKLQRAGILSLVPKEHYFRDIKNALNYGQSLLPLNMNHSEISAV